jgi:hypothetical protein
MPGKKRRKTHKMKRRRGGTKRVQPEELQKCDSFCRKTYVNKHREWLRKSYSTNPDPYYTRERIEKLLGNVDVEHKISECKQIYCNPGCDGWSRSSLRYVCPACKELYRKNAKEGLITMCRYDDVVK